MPLFSFLLTIFVEALFPRTKAEREIDTGSVEELCRALPRAPKPPLGTAESVFAYKDERVRKLVWDIKYKKLPHALSIAGLALYGAITSMSHAPVILIPMPISERRRKERGYNQCELIVTSILAEALKRNNKNLRTINNVLIRTHHLSRQTTKNREERLGVARNIFAVREDVLKELISIDADFLNGNFLVIDDVITTGSTMSAAIDALKSAGFKNVKGMSVAH